MAYGDYDGPDKPNKGHEGGACNRQRCQAEPALWWNHGSHSWYCGDCAKDIGEDHVNAHSWLANFARYFPRQERFPMFETREMMDARAKVERTSPATLAPRQQGKTEADYAEIELRVLASMTPEERRYYPIVTNQHVNRQQRRAAERAELKRLRKRS